jgi:hypothetical protein
MDNLTPSQKVRLQLEKQMTQDAIARLEKYERENNSILPTFMGENGKIKRLGHGESRTAIATNLFYGIGEEMRPIPVRGGLPMVDNKPRLAPPIAAIPEPPIEVIFAEYGFTIGAGIQGDMGAGTETLSAFGSTSSPAFSEVTGGLSGEYDLFGQIDGLTGYFTGTILDTATEIWSFGGGAASINFTLTDPTILFITVRIEAGSQFLEQEIDLEGLGSAIVGFDPPPEPSLLLFPATLNYSVTFSNPRRE